MNSLKQFLNKITFGFIYPSFGQNNVEQNGDVEQDKVVFPHELDLRELTSNMQRVAKVEAPKFIRDYDAEQGGFTPLIQRVIRAIKNEWEAWEQSYCADLQDAETLLREQKAAYSPEKEAKDFETKVEERNSTLLEDLKNAFRVRETNKLRAKTVKQRYNDVMDELEAMRIAFTGDANKGLSGKTNIWTTLAIVFFVLAIGAVENILGFGTFKFESDTLTAFALSTTVVAVFTAMAYLGATGGAKLLANKDAHRRFYSTYRTERSYPKDRHENPIVPHPPSLSAWAQFLLGTGLFLLASVILLVGRLGIIEKMSADDSSMYLTGAIALIFLNFILYIFKLLTGAKYDSSDIDSYKAIEAELALLKEEKKAIHPDAYLGLIDEALVNYEADIDEAKGRLHQGIEYIRGLAFSYQALHGQYQEGWRKTRDFFRLALSELGRAAIRNEDVPEVDVARVLDAEDNTFINDLEMSVDRRLENDTFLGHVMDWVPEVPVLNEGSRIADFAGLIKEVETEVVEETRRELAQGSDSADQFNIRKW